MENKKPLPHFENEEAEARWYYEHRNELDDYFGAPRPAEGNLAERLGLKRTAPRPTDPAPSDAPSTPITIRLGQADLAAVRAIATRKGLPYQTMLKSVIHEFVMREQK